MFRPLFRFILLRLLGWTIQDDRPAGLRQYIVVVAPHTSNWDFIVGIMVRSIVRMNDVRYLAKASLFKPPFGWIFRMLGGYPVDGSKSQNLVDQVVEYFEADPDFKLAITPEGTRKYVEKWKTGFYHIAKKADVPIILASMDFGRKHVEFTPPFVMSDDPEADIERMKDHYRKVQGKVPENGVR